MAMQEHQDPAAEAAHGTPAGAAEAHGAAAGHESSGGLPQFDFAQWPGQIAWFLVIFFVVLAFVRFFVTPKLGGTILARDGKIEGDIAEARRMKDAADADAAEAASEIAAARGRAQKVAADARAKAQGEIAAALAEEEAKLAGVAAEAEARIAKARDAAMANVQTIGAEAAEAIVEKLTGRKATSAELAAVRS